MNKYTKILVLVATCLAIGYFSGIVTRASIAGWYSMIEKPWFNPPNSIFAPVWTTLYILMGISGGLVWDKIEENREEVKKALVFFAIQLALNALWSFLFFGLKNPLLALIEIVLLALMIYETLYKFLKINKTAGYLFVPYLLWVCFAAILNGSIWWLNK
ncbi:TspO/MBR family protein [Flavobacterium sp. 3HN19-14]|uniref:TspO/MBR family protein n=1 Tax=Flavobacterium sp. 3HN19-14 TaxID=3448133 RepID=UPI003EDE8057